MASPLDTLDKIVGSVEGLVRAKGKKGIAGIWTDDHAIIGAAAQTKALGIKKFDTISPFPLHGIDEAMGIPRSFIPWVTFIMGLAGCAFGTWFTWWTSAVNWPIIIAGKPHWSLPAFVPIIFECTILFAALSSVGAMFALNGLPKIDPPTIDPDLTCHKFAIFVPEDDPNYDADKLESLFKEHGAIEVKKAEF
ncbi:MAG: DUF3341 domain-containing protein [Bdellovibrionales bacterium]|nr:DUF3341 domain-containing protein [Bdellovibrionales bacterium]